MKTCPIVKHFATAGSKFCQILNKPSTICPRFWKLCQRGEISPNLVSLPSKILPIYIIVLSLSFMHWSRCCSASAAFLLANAILYRILSSVEIGAEPVLPITNRLIISKDFNGLCCKPTKQAHHL